MIYKNLIIQILQIANELMRNEVMPFNERYKIRYNIVFYRTNKRSVMQTLD